MILDIYKDALEYSAKDWKTLVILGVICLFSFLLLPAFLITGYNYRVINTAVHGIINGSVQVIYLLVPMIIFLVFALIAGHISGIASGVLIFIGCLITLVVGVAACLMSQMGICHMAYNDGAFSKAFALSEIKEVIDEIGWFECILTYIGLIIIVFVISVVVTTLIGIIFALFGVSGAFLGVDPSGILLLGTFINSTIAMFIVGPYLSIFASRSMGLLYTMQI